MRITDTKISPTVDYNVYDRRFNETIKMINCWGYGNTALMFGEKAPFETAICKELDIELHCTNFNLDYEFPIITQRHDTMFCCELIEHLLNPLWFFSQARDLMTDKTLMYLTYPIQPHWAWCAGHFHEYDRSRFLYLLREAGLEVVDYKQYINWKSIRGIRPIIRNTPLGWLKQQIYVLKKGKLRCDMV